VNETVVARLRPHGRAMFLPTVILLALAAAAGYFGGKFSEDWQNTAVLITAAVLAVFGWFVPLVSWLSQNYTITTRRVIVRSGVLVRSRQEVLHALGHDVTVRRSALQALFGSGDVLVSTGLDRPVVLRDVPSAALVQATLHDLMEANRPGPPSAMSIG
jgi:uncharacterized membrane protein YdbT with pleckstrin-like domain